jgi:hypothetical protein
VKLHELRARLRQQHATEELDAEVKIVKAWAVDPGGPDWAAGAPPTHRNCRSGTFTECGNCGVRAIVFYETSPKHGRYSPCAVCNHHRKGAVEVRCARCGDCFETTVEHYLTIKLALCAHCEKP